MIDDRPANRTPRARARARARPSDGLAAFAALLAVVYIVGTLVFALEVMGAV